MFRNSENDRATVFGCGECTNKKHTMNSSDSVDSTEKNSTQSDAHWSKSLRVVQIVLGIWAFISLGCGILFREQLDSMLSIGGAPFGFWMAQQGAIIGFLLLLVLYMVLMNGIDKKHGFGEGDDA